MPDDQRYVFEDPRFAQADPRTGRPSRESEGQEPSVVLVEPPRRGCLRSCFSGCMWIGVALLIVGAVAAYFIARNWRDWTADLGVQVVEQTLEASDLPAPEKAEIGAQVDRVATAFREGKLSARQIEALVQRLAASPLATSLVVAAVESKYLQKSGLPEEEKSAGRTTLRRFARGVIDSSIPEAQRDAALAHLADRDADGGWTLRERVSDDELRAFFAAAEAEADAAQIPDEPEVVDPSEELRRVIDDALGEGAPPAPAP